MYQSHTKFLQFERNTTFMSKHKANVEESRKSLKIYRG